LNSANIVIPRIEGYPIKVIAALFNSSPYQFLFQKKFSSIKVLRSHIEQLPLPEWDQKTFEELLKLLDTVMQGKSSFKELDKYIINKFNFTPKEQIQIKS
jgi:hypothetical protein